MTIMGGPLWNSPEPGPYRQPPDRGILRAPCSTTSARGRGRCSRAKLEAGRGARRATEIRSSATSRYSDGHPRNVVLDRLEVDGLGRSALTTSSWSRGEIGGAMQPHDGSNGVPRTSHHKSPGRTSKSRRRGSKSRRRRSKSRRRASKSLRCPGYAAPQSTRALRGRTSPDAPSGEASIRPSRGTVARSELDVPKST